MNELSRFLESPKPGVSKTMIFSDWGSPLKYVNTPLTADVNEAVPAEYANTFFLHIEFPTDDFPWPVTPIRQMTLNLSCKLQTSPQFTKSSSFKVASISVITSVSS